MATDVSATGLYSFRQVSFVFLGSGNIVVCLKHVGITDSIRDMLKMSVKTPASWLTHARSTRPGNPSGPAAFYKTCLKVLLTQSSGTADALMHTSVLLASKRA